MDRYIRLDAHASSCTLGVLGPSHLRGRVLSCVDIRLQLCCVRYAMLWPLGHT